jgi:hypothetical protein
VAASGHDAFGYFATTNVAETVALLVRIQRAAIERKLTDVFDATATILTDLLNDLNSVAAEYAVLADTTIIRILIETRAQNRPTTGELATHIRSEPGPLGSVRVALIEELDRAINPDSGYGPFWRAQEYGTGSSGEGVDVPSQIGRYFRGFFQPSGTPPEAAQRGLRVGTDLAFVSDSSGGFGRISVDLPGRHFLSGGTAEVGAKYLQRIDALATAYDKRISDLRKLITESRARRTFTYRLDA